MKTEKTLQTIILICILLVCGCKQTDSNSNKTIETVISATKEKEPSISEKTIKTQLENKPIEIVEKSIKTADTSKQTIKNKVETPFLISDGLYYEPKFCGKDKLIYTNLDGTKIFLKSLSTNKTKTILEGTNFRNNFSWDKKDCNSILYKSKTRDYKVLINKINSTTNKITTLKNLPSLVGLDAISANDTIYYLDKKSLQIEGRYLDKKWSVSQNNKSYYGLLLSPNGKLLAAHSGSNIFIIDTQTKKSQLLGKGIITNWNADSEHLIGFLDSSNDGHAISNSDLFVFNAKTLKSKKLTHTTNTYEAQPYFDSDNKIGYVDLKNGGIYLKSFNYIVQ